jgi:hypothetical protein
MSVHQSQSESDFQFELGLRLSRDSIKQFLATGMIEIPKDFPPAQVDTAEEKREYVKTEKENKQTA